MESLLAPFAGARSRKLAERLIGKFGSPGGVIFATREQLRDAGGDDLDIVELIAAARELVEIGLREDVIGSRVETTDPRFIQYLKLALGRSRIERLYAVFVDSEIRFIRGETISIGTREGIEGRIGHLFQRVMDLRASGLLLAHNHPSGDCRPSSKDLRATVIVSETASRLDLFLVDHLIVTTNAVYSIKGERTL